MRTHGQQLLEVPEEPLSQFTASLQYLKTKRQCYLLSYTLKDSISPLPVV